MDDISPGGRRMTYAELGAARGISAASAERLVRRRRWPRQVGNDGVARVLVPAGEDQKAGRVTPKHHGMIAAPDTGDRPGVTTSQDIGAVIREAIREVVTPLSAQLEHERQRADSLQAKLDDAMTAERIARDEAAGLRTQLDYLQARGLWGRIWNKR